MTRAGPLDVARQVRLADGVLDYTLRRSRRARHLRVTVDPVRGVVVTIPVRGAIRAVDAFLVEREAWLRRHLRAHAQQRARIAARRPFEQAGRILFRGELHPLRVERAVPGTRRTLVALCGDGDGHLAGDPGDPGDPGEIVLMVATADRRTAARVLEDWFREQALAAITAEIDRQAPSLGVTPVAVTLRDPRTRWGSATRTRRLSFSWRLILAPPRALETVVVHELAHLRVFGHGPAFWAVVASRIPDHRAWRTWLRDHSLELHAALDDAGDAGDADADADANAAIPFGQLSFAGKLAI